MPLPSTMTPIASNTLSNSTTQEVSFTNIPQNYTDLVLVVNSGKTLNVSNTMNVRVNSDSSSIYSGTRVWNDGSGVSSDRSTNSNTMFTQSPQFNYVGSLFTCHFMNYSNSTTYKTMLGRQGTASSTAGGASVTVSLWRSTSAITSIQLQLDFGSSNRWYTGSTFTLYGIKAAS